MKKYKIVLWQVELECGLTKKNIGNMLNLLDECDRGYMTLEFDSENNSSAFGFITSDYYEELDYNSEEIGKVIIPILNNWENESPASEYKMIDGEVIYMGCDCETIIA